MSRPRPRSQALYQRACALLPAGVSSPVRAFQAVGGTPVFFREGSGGRITDVDGNEYLDFVLSWGPLLLGHAHPAVVEAVAAAAARGTSFGAPCEAEVELAAEVIGRCPGAERVRFVSSGTEAVMTAVRLARASTGRPLVVKFSGCYHGHADPLLVQAGSGAATFGVPSSAGVPPEVTRHTAVLPLDDEEAFGRLMAERGGELAAVLVEPVPANCGLLLQRPSFLSFLRERTRELSALLVFDEVISGFRLARGGAAQRFGVVPDLATYGKVLGGGLPAGAVAGRAQTMELLAPLGPVYQAGTLSGNPLAMAAGLATLRAADAEGALERLEELGALLAERMGAGIAARGIDASFVSLGSLFWIHWGSGPPPRRAEDLPSHAAARYRTLFAHALERGVSLAPSAYEVGFLCAAHREADVERLAGVLLEGMETALRRGKG